MSVLAAQSYHKSVPPKEMVLEFNRDPLFHSAEFLEAKNHFQTTLFQQALDYYISRDTKSFEAGLSYLKYEHERRSQELKDMFRLARRYGVH